MKTFYLVLLSLLFAVNVNSQSDDSLRFQIFNLADLDTLVKEEKELIISVSRLSETVGEFSQQIIIIEGDEIRKFGYTTLVDVLKYIPGFRTSQPGNAYHGETFLMQGLLGNEYVKFMINGVPIQPEAVQGMPIGAQLPIRHAERIEIILGASSASYGNDAVAGVINIVMPQVEQPVFAWGDVSVQTPQTSNFNLTLGGKTGKGRNIINYQLFASSFHADNVNLLIPADSVKVSTNSINWIQMDLLSSTSAESDNEYFYPNINAMKRESRCMGTSVKYRNLEFTAMRLYRVEASGFGTHPFQQSYHDIGLTAGERITSMSLKMKIKQKKRRKTTINASYLKYRMLPNSSYFAIMNGLSNGRNYMYSRSTDINFDMQTAYELNPQLKMTYGLGLDYSFSLAFMNYLARPNKDIRDNFWKEDTTLLLTPSATDSQWESISKIDYTVPKEYFLRLNLAPFFQVSFKSKNEKIKINAGYRYDINSFSKVLPKIGMVYYPNNRIRINMSYEEGYRANKSYYSFDNYFVPDSNYAQGSKLRRTKNSLKPETIKSWQAGVQVLMGNTCKLNVNYYGHYMQDKLFNKSYFTDTNSIVSGKMVGFGHFNSVSYSLLNSLSISSTFTFTINAIVVDILFAYEYSKGKEILAVAEDIESFAQTSYPYRFVPTHTRKTTIDFTYNDLIISFRRSVYGEFLADFLRVNDVVSTPMIHHKSQNLDILIYKQLFRQLSLFTGVNNIFGKVQSGIPYSGLTNTWSFNPQYGRVFKFGLTFKLN